MDMTNLRPDLQPNPILVTPDGKRYQTGEYHRARIYDTIVIPAGAVATDVLKFFNPANKSPLDTNINSQAKIPAGQVLMITRVGIDVLPVRGNTQISGSDWKKVMNAFFLDFKVNKIEVALGPLPHFPPGWGLSGFTQEAGQSVVSNGVANDSAPVGLISGVTIDNNYEMLASVQAPLRTPWDVGVARPVLDNALYLQLTVEGMQFQAALIDGNAG